MFSITALPLVVIRKPQRQSRQQAQPATRSQEVLDHNDQLRSVELNDQPRIGWHR